MADAEVVPGLAALGIRGYTTTRAAGSFGLHTAEPVRDVMDRWSTLQHELAPRGGRLATIAQVHGREILVHGPPWSGWLRGPAADGHASIERGTALAVTVADCVPVFVAHPSGAVALLHSGWRGTADRIVQHAIGLLERLGLDPAELLLHLGPAICGSCYEVSGDVYARLTGTDSGKPATIDLRALIAAHAREMGVTRITQSSSCTRCDNDRFFSHRAGDAGRQIGVIRADA